MSQRVNSYVSDEIFQRLEDYTTQAHRSRSGVINLAIIELLDKYAPTPRKSIHYTERKETHEEKSKSQAEVHDL